VKASGAGAAAAVATEAATAVNVASAGSRSVPHPGGTDEEARRVFWPFLIFGLPGLELVGSGVK
jgi:hypothetical protein